MTRSAIYDAEVLHRRADPAHTVAQRIRLAYLATAELPGVVRGRRWWSDRPAPVWFRRRDYLDGSDAPLERCLSDLVRERTGRPLPGPVAMLTQLRTMGWLFNPLTTYYCFGSDGETLAFVVLEVTNTPWRERHWYVLDAEAMTNPGVAFDKSFHVSPFLPMDMTYHVCAPVPGEQLRLTFAATRADRAGGVHRVIDVELRGERESLAEPPRLRDAVGRATQTARVSAGIYAHAAVLGVRGASFHRHPARRAATAESRPDPRSTP